MFGGRSGGSYRCSDCGITYPPLEAHKTCEVCDQKTSYFSDVEADEDWEDDVRLARLHPEKAAGRDPREYRVGRYIELGFTRVQSRVLADTIVLRVAPVRHDKRPGATVVREPDLLSPLWHGDVASALERGCSLQMAYDIYRGDDLPLGHPLATL
jgi:hypothetical protein